MAIVLNMACGLANRMFQYAYYLHLRQEGYDAKVDYFKESKLAHENVEWTRIFPRADFREAGKREIMMLGGGHDTISKIVRKCFPALTRVAEMPTAFSLYEPGSKDDSRYLLGVFQNAEVVESVKDELLKRFKFSDFEEGSKNTSLAMRLREENSVAIHIRKAPDYQKIKWYQNTCALEYYTAAAEYIRSKVGDARFYVFTDNPEWARENLRGFKFTLVEDNPTSGWGCHYDMQLMAECRHNIIANSTYSWWGAFLNDNPDKIVVCPDAWFNSRVVEDYKSTPLLCKGWTAI